MKQFIIAGVVALLASTVAYAEQPTDPSGYGQAFARGAQSAPGFVGGEISQRASTKFGGSGKTEGHKTQEDLIRYSGNSNGVREDCEDDADVICFWE